jgi:hypothetical protein
MSSVDHAVSEQVRKRLLIQGEDIAKDGNEGRRGKESVGGL